MLNDPNFQNTFIPLVLRVMLAAIFIYHGVTKIADRNNDWGATWATNMWLKQAKVPQAPIAELDKGLTRLAAENRALRKRAEQLKQEGEKLSAGAEKDDNAKKQEENAKKQEENTKKQGEYLLAEERIRVAFAASAPLPDALEYHWVQLLVAWGELLCGLAMLLGLFTRVAAVALIVIMAGAIYTVEGPEGFANVATGGYEYNLAIVAMCVVLLIKGAGPASVDNWFRSGRKAAQEKRQPVAV